VVDPSNREMDEDKGNKNRRKKEIKTIEEP
jgi:hypothetical protein